MKNSGYPRGVTLVGGRWRGTMYRDRIKYNLGTFPTLEAAFNALAEAREMTIEDFLEKYPRGTRPGRRAGQKTVVPQKDRDPPRLPTSEELARRRSWMALTTGWHQAVTGTPPAYRVSV